MKNNEINKLKKEKKMDKISIDIINLSIKKLKNDNNKDIKTSNNNDVQEYLLNNKFDNFLQKLKNKKIFFKKFLRIIEYLNKIILIEKDIKYKSPKFQNIDKIDKIILYIIKNNINNNNHLLNKKIFKILILLIYWEVIPINNFILIVNIFLNSAIHKITKENQIINKISLFKRSPLYFIHDLFKALTNISRKNINDEIHLKLIDELMKILNKVIFSYPYNLEINKLSIWFTLLGNKIISLKSESILLYTKLIYFLVNIYKYSFQDIFYYKYIFSKCAISFDYYINSLDFFITLFKEEEKYKSKNKFNIKNGFYIYNNFPLTLNQIKFKLKSYSLIFSFKLTKIPNNKDNIILFNLENVEQKKIIIRFIINKADKTLKITDTKNTEWNTNIQINLNQDYFICLSQEGKMFGKSIDLFINDDQQKNGFNYYNNTSICYPDFEHNMILELGKSNFEGIFGELLIINKIIKNEDINHLYNLKENYGEILCSLNYKYDFTYKKNLYTDKNEDIIFFQKSKFQCILKILTYEIHSLLKQETNCINNKPYGELKYKNYNNIDNYNNNTPIRVYKLIYSIEKFFNNHGLEYLIFQLHRIISLSENDDALNYYLYKTLSFLLEIMELGSEYIFPKKDNKVKTEIKYINVILSLITVLNTNKRILKLNEKIRDIFLEFSKIYSDKKASLILQKINFSIILDDNIFKKCNIQFYEKLFDVLNNYLINNEKDNSLLYKEIFYKFLLLDYIIESQEIKHKKYIEILSYFLIEKDKDKNKKKDIQTLTKIFINYLIEIKKPKKIYHYLKFIYLNIDSIKPLYEENQKFINYISKNLNDNSSNNNKYIQYNQILYFLLNNIMKKNEKKNEDIFDYIKNPDYKFMKSIFIRNFNVNNKTKLNFIKSSLNYENEMILLQHYIDKKINILSMLDYNTFLNKLNILINYYYKLYEQYLLEKNNNKNKEILLKQSIKLILDLFEEISNIKKLKNIDGGKNLSADNIIKKKEKDNYNETNKNKETPIIKFINELFCSNSIKLLFILYFNLYQEKEFNEKKFIKYINISIDKIYNPFFFYLLLPSTTLSDDILINNNYKAKILELIINEIISINNIIIKNSTYINNILALNSIILLIRIYHIIIENNIFMNNELEKNIILFLKFIFDNYFIYSKYIFEINFIDENIIDNKKDENIINNKKDENKLDNSMNIIEKEKKENKKKLILEIALDIIFSMLEKSENKDLIAFLNNNLKINENNSIFYTIDSFFFNEINNNINHSYKYHMIKLLNNPQITTKYCNGTNLSNILYCIYFLIYFINKLTFFNIYYIQKDEVNEKIKNEIINLLNKAIEVVFKNTLNIFKEYLKKIKKIKTKNKLDNEILFKLYDFIFDHFLKNYKETNFKFYEGKEIFEYFIKLIQNLKKSDDFDRSNFPLPLSYRTLSNDSEFSLSKSKLRKTTYTENESILKEEKCPKERKINMDNILFYNKRLRSSSENNKEIFNKYDNEYYKKLMLKTYEENNNKIVEEVPSNENSQDNQNMIIIDKENDNNMDSSQLGYNKDNNLSNNESSSSDIDSDNDLKFTSNYNCGITNNNDTLIESYNDNINLKKRSSSITKNLKYSVLSTENEYQFQEKMNDEDSVNVKNSRKNRKLLTVHLENFKININNENLIENEHIILKNKLNKIDIPFLYCKLLILNKDAPKWLRIIFNPKRTIFKIFCLSFKKYIFNNKRFNKLKNTFKIKYKKKELEKSIPEEDNYILKYPSKLKNFTCSDYYKPFLKPMLNFFENEYFKSAHSYMKNDIYLKDIKERDKFGLINYEKIFLSLKENSYVEENLKIRCENISNKGSIFGAIYLLNSLMVFRDHSDIDIRKKGDIPELQKLFFLYSSDESDRLEKQNKYIIIYYSEIKEIILRKYCFNEIAYEIFMKDCRSYFFNFFSVKNRDKFYDNFINKINSINAKIKKERQKEDTFKKYKYDNNYVNILLIDEPKKYFEKNEFRSKYVKDEITNFKYLLLVNKFSNRTYNDCNQYLVFPLLYMDVNKMIERNLNKAICMNKDLNEEDIIKFKNNFESMGYHFNIHYSTMAYILYYLMRVIPFTFSQIKLQSGHFDAPSRMFTSLENLLYVFSVSDENRELCPEFFYSFESFLNLNYNNFGYIKNNNKQINHFCTNQNIGIVEFIIDLRKILEKRELSDWINNIFGSNQLNDNIESFNKFPEYSYEKYNNNNKVKEALISEIDEDNMNDKFKEYVNDKIKDLRNNIKLLSLGCTPSQLFKNPHPIKEKNIKKINISFEEKNDNKKKKENH